MALTRSARRIRQEDLIDLDDGDYRAHVRSELQKARHSRAVRVARASDGLVALVLLAVIAAIVLHHYGYITIVTK
jgi:hypothetical protein